MMFWKKIYQKWFLKKINDNYLNWLNEICDGEIRIKNYLEKTNINYIREKTFEDCSNNKKLRFDFYLPEKNIIVEYDGKHHYKPIDWFGGEYTLNKMIISDNIKNEYCSKNNIRLIRIPYTQLKNIIDILKKELINNVELET